MAVELPITNAVGATTVSNNNNNIKINGRSGKKKSKKGFTTFCTPKSFLISLLVSIGLIFVGVIVFKKFIMPDDFTPDLASFPKFMPDPDLCFADKDNIQWKSKNGNIFANDIPVQIKGLSWFGNEGHAHTFGGLNYTSVEQVLNWVQGYEFNALRLPFSLEWALSDEEEHLPPKEKYVSKKYKGQSVWDIMENVIDEAGKRGILVCLDMHYLEYQAISEVWYSINKEYDHHASEIQVQDFTEDDLLAGWDRVLDRFGSKWNVFAIDIKNEPFGIATWGDEDPDTNINRFYERAIRHFARREEKSGFHGLYLVEGTQNNNGTDGTDEKEFCSYDADGVYENCQFPFWWGGNFMGAKKYPIDVTDIDQELSKETYKNVDLDEVNDRVVYSPHIYGPDVFDHYYFDFPDLKDVLRTIWDEQTGWLAESTKKGIIIGEWGGSMEGKDRKIQRYLADWLVENCMTNQFWWALNPGSGDVGGLFSYKWKDLDERKTQTIKKVNPKPSQFSFDDDDNLCFKIGAPASPFCRTSYEIKKEYLNVEATSRVMNSKTYQERNDREN